MCELSDVIFILMKKYLQMVPVSRLKLNEILDKDHSEHIQNDILSYVVNNELSAKYPLLFSYRLHFLKMLLQKLESIGCEVVDDVYTSYTDIVSTPVLHQEYVHSLYLLPHDHRVLDDNGKVIKIGEAHQMISDGTTGLKSWLAGKVLVNLWANNDMPNINRKYILELGSGSGLLGISLCRMHKPERIVLTDCHSAVLQLLHHNVRINEDSTDGNENADTINGCVVNVECLDWTQCMGSGGHETLEFLLESYGSPHMVVATDVIYDPDLFAPFLHIMRYLLRVSSVNTQVIISSTIRNMETFQHFRNLLDEYGLEYRMIKSIAATEESSDNSIIYCQPTEPPLTVEIANIVLQ